MSEETQKQLSLEKREVIFTYMRAAERRVEISPSPHPGCGGQGGVSISCSRGKFRLEWL